MTMAKLTKCRCSQEAHFTKGVRPRNVNRKVSMDQKNSNSVQLNSININCVSAKGQGLAKVTLTLKSLHFSELPDA